MTIQWGRGLLLTMLALAAGCASGGSIDHSAGDHIDAAYRLARKGYWQEALFHYERAAELEPSEPEVLNNIAVALEAVGRYEDAKQAYERARQVSPNDSVLGRNYRAFMEFYLAHVNPPEKPKAGEEDQEDEKKDS